MRAVIRPGTARGVVAAPPSKSVAHRLLICAGLSAGESVIRRQHRPGARLRSPDLRAHGTALPRVGQHAALYAAALSAFRKYDEAGGQREAAFTAALRL